MTVARGRPPIVRDCRAWKHAIATCDAEGRARPVHSRQECQFSNSSWRFTGTMGISDANHGGHPLMQYIPTRGEST